MWSRRASVGMSQLAMGVAFWFVVTDSVTLRILALAFAARGVSQLVIAYLRHPDRIAKREDRKTLPPRQDG